LGSDIWSLARVPVVRTILRQVLADATYRFADGYQLAADVQALSGKNCDFMPSSRQLRLTDKTLRTQPPYRVTFLGRWHPNKGIDLLLDALELLDEPAWHHIECVRIFGGGPLEQEVRSRAERLARLDRPVQVGGYLDQEQATHLLQDTDYLLLPSRIESIPVVFSDALQTACPIIAMPVGDLPLLFERYRYGELASQVTAEAFASALQRALQGSPADFAPEIGKARSVFDVAQAVSRLQQRIGSRQHPLTAS
jgi:glycosyltransferase involved in cell wall biosynthesis